MPAANKKLKIQEPSLSKRVKKASILNAVSELQDAKAAGVTKRAKAGAVITDEMLIQIKKGLETSVGSKSKVKRLSVMKQQKPQVKRLTRDGTVTSEEEQIKKKLTPDSSPMAEATNEKSTKKKQAKMESKPAEMPHSEHKLGIKQKLSPKNENTSESRQASPSHAYYLRSVPGMPSAELNSSSVKSVDRPSKTKKLKLSPEPLFAVPAALPSTAKRANVAKKIAEQRKRESFDISFSMLDSKKRHSLPLSGKNSVTAGATLETPLKPSMKRKFDDDAEMSSAKKRVSSGLGKLPFLMDSEKSQKSLSVRIARVDDVMSISQSEDSTKSFQHLTSSLAGEGFTTDTGLSAVNANSSMNVLHDDLHLRPLAKLAAGDLSSPFELVASKSDAKRRSGVHWDTSAIKTRLIESINPNAKLTRSAYSSSNGNDQVDFGSASADYGYPSASNFTPKQSILKRRSDNDLQSAADAKLTVGVQSRKWKRCRTLLHFLLLVGLPIVIGLCAYAYHMNYL